MMIQVGSRVVFRSRDKEFTGEVLELRGEHARCAFADGRTAWVPLISLSLESPPLLPYGGANAMLSNAALSPTRSLAPSRYPPAAPSQDQPLETWQIALIYLGLTVFPLGCSIIGAFVYSLPYYIWRKDKPNRARQWNQHVWYAVAACFPFWIGVGIVYTLVAGSQRQRENSAVIATGQIPTSWKTWDADACSIQTPPDWEQNSHAARTDSKLELVSRPDTLLIFIQEPVADLAPHLSVEQYAETSGDAPGALPLTSATAGKIGSYDARREVHAGLVDGRRMSYLRYVLRSSSHFHQIVAVTQTSTFAADEALLTRIIESARCGNDRPSGTAL